MDDTVCTWKSVMRRFVAALTAFLGFVPLSSLLAADEASRPNIVFILADDFGVGDVHALYPANKIATPVPITRSTPKRAMSEPVTKEGANIAITCAVITPAAAP